MKKFAFACFICCLFLVTGCGCDQKRNSTPIKEDEKEKTALQDSGKLPNKKVNGLSFTKTSISYVEDMSTFVSMVKNTTKKPITVEVIEVTIKNNRGKVLTVVPGFLSGTLEPGEEKPFVAYINMDLSAAVDVEYKF